MNAGQTSKGSLLVETRELTKRYGKMTALDGCTMGVEPGEIFGLLGPNGAGKTTLLRLLLGFLRPTAGSATVAGLDCVRHSVQVRHRVAYLPAEARLFRQMRARDVLDFFAHVRPDGSVARGRQLARRLDLDLTRRVAYMSTGMRQKLALTAALANSTRLLIMDEPTANLDPTVRRVVADLVREAQADGRTILFSSHVLSEVEDLCDRVTIMRQGKPVYVQNLSELRKQHCIRAALDGPLPELPPALRQHAVVRQSAGQVLIESPGELTPLLGWLSTLPLRELRIEPIGLRAVYDRFHLEE